MRVLIDTNVLISAILSPNSTPFRAYVKAASYPYHAVICEQNVVELQRIFQKKFPHRLGVLEKFLAIALLSLEVIRIPEDESIAEQLVRDKKDRPILRAAIHAKVDILVTGDKDFLESGIDHPKAMTPAMFLQYYQE